MTMENNEKDNAKALAVIDAQFDIDWGAEGAQWTGAQVQKFIKDNFRALFNTCTELNNSITKLENTDSTNFEAGKTFASKVSTDGCFILYTNSTSSSLLAAPHWDWENIYKKQLQEDISHLVGILVLRDGQQPLVIAPQVAYLAWDKGSNIQINSTSTASNLQVLVTGNSGKTFTDKIMESAVSLFGDEANWSQYAAGHCTKYARTIAAGKWWLPSISELVCIKQHLQGINRCLKAVGLYELGDEIWSANEWGASYALTLNVETMGIVRKAKTAKAYVLPITTLPTSIYWSNGTI